MSHLCHSFPGSREESWSSLELLLVHPLFRIVCNSFSVIGEEDYAAIAQSQQSMPQRGEGLADTLDVSPF